MPQDVFVSYAHVDDGALAPDVGWVTTLVKRLQIKLAQRLGRADAFSLWMDPQLSGNKPLTAEILDQIAASATMLVIHSVGYQASEWCQREKNNFLQRAHDLGSGLFVVERDSTPRPAELRDRRGYKFWSADPLSRKQRILGDPPLPEDLARYFALIDDIAGDLAAELRARRAKPTDKRPARATVFLAEVTDDLDPVRDDVRRYLLQQDIVVVPDQTSFPRTSETDFLAAVDADLGRGTVFVQLLSAVAGRKPPDGAHSFVQLQFERARAAGRSILQWRPPDLSVAAVANAEHAALLEGEHVLAIGLEELKAEIVARALKKPEPPRPHPVGLVFVNAESHDRTFAEDLASFLQRLGADSVLPLQDTDPAQVRADLERNLLDCDKLILVYGATTPVWVREQLRYARRVLPRRENGQPTLAVYHGPPPPKSGVGFQLVNQLTIDGTGGFNEEGLRSFLAAVVSS